MTQKLEYENVLKWKRDELEKKTYDEIVLYRKGLISGEQLCTVIKGYAEELSRYESMAKSFFRKTPTLKLFE